MLRFACLGSGSEGNALVVHAQCGLLPTRILVDNGFGPRLLEKRLARVGLAFADINAIVVTHEHSDHAGGVAALLKRRPMPLFATAGTARAARLQHSPHWRRIQAAMPITLGELWVLPFAVPHDAEEPVQFVFSDGDRRLGLLTDIGEPTLDVAAALSGVHALLLECNHDAEMLRTGTYPENLKARIRGNRGHLSNVQAGQLLGLVDRSALNFIAAAHLSRRNNRPQLARAALADVLRCKDADVAIADQDLGLDWIDV